MTCHADLTATWRCVVSPIGGRQLRKQVRGILTTPGLGGGLTAEGGGRDTGRIDRPAALRSRRLVDEAVGVGERVTDGALPAGVVLATEEGEHSAKRRVYVADRERADGRGPYRRRDEAGVRVRRLRVAAVAAMRNAIHCKHTTVITLLDISIF